MGIYFYFAVSELLPWNILNMTRSFRLNPHIYVRNGVLLLKTKIIKCISSLNFLSGSICLLCLFCPLPNIFISIVYAHWLHVPFLSASQHPKITFSKPTVECQSPASQPTCSLCRLSLLRYLKLQMAPFFHNFLFFILGFYLLWLCWIFLSSFWVFPSQLKCWICMCLFSTFLFVVLLPGQS